MTWYSRSDYGSHNPNAGHNANGDTAAWGGYQWQNCPPSSLLGTTDYTSRFGQRLRVTTRKEIVELMTLMFRIADKHNYCVYSNKDGENWGPWGMDCRAVSGTSTPSGHSKGLSMDWNAPYNPYSYTFQSDMPPAMVADVEACGWYWGGRYEGQKYDAMHYGYCFKPADVAGHVAKANSILGSAPIDPLPPEEITVPLTVVRAAGVDYGYDADAMSLFIRIPTQSYYNNLEYLDIIKVGHGSAKPVEQNIVDWLRGQVAGSGGRVYEPNE